MKCICEIIEVGSREEIVYKGYSKLAIARHENRFKNGYYLEVVADDGNPCRKIFYCPFCGRDLDC